MKSRIRRKRDKSRVKWEAFREWENGTRDTEGYTGIQRHLMLELRLSPRDYLASCT